MNLFDSLDSKFAKQQLVASLYTLLTFNLLFAAFIYWSLPFAMNTPNGAEAGFVFLMVIMYVFMPLLGLASFVWAKNDWYLPWLGALLLIWGAPINPTPFDVFHRMTKEQIFQVQNVEFAVALVLSFWTIYRGIKAYKRVSN